MEAMSITRSIAAAQLEAIVDAYGLAGTLDMLDTVCTLKAVHVAETWQDSVTAKTWDRAGRRINAARLSIAKEGI